MVKNYHAGDLLSPALESLCNKKLSKLEKYGEDMTCDIFMTMEGKEYVMKVVLKNKKTELVARAKSNDMYKNIDTCVDTLKLQISKEKTDRLHVKREDVVSND